MWIELLLVFAAGGFIYGFIEILFSGTTHWTMALSGGFCFTLIYLLSTRTNLSILAVCIIGTLIITATEFAVGCIVNLKLRWNVWDYSNNRFNIKGQICPLFMAIWFILCFPGVILANFLNGIIYNLI